MPLTLSLTANDPARTTYTLLAGSGSDVWKLTAADWGNPASPGSFSGPRGDLGARQVASAPDNRVVTLGFRTSPSATPSSLDNLAAQLDDVAEVVRAVNLWGGTLTRKHSGQTYRQHLDILAGGATVGPWTNRAEFSGKADWGVQLVCAPRAYGDPMELADAFLTDTRGDYTFDAGAAASLSVSGAELVPAGTTTLRAIHTAVGYRYGDVRVEMTFLPGATLAYHEGGVVLKRTGSGDYLRAIIFDSGAASTMFLSKFVGGVEGGLNNVGVARISQGQAYRITLTIEGNRLTAEYYAAAGDEPYRNGPTILTHTLSSADAALFGDSVMGQCGFHWKVVDTGERATDFSVQPFCYLTPSAWTEVQATGTIPGDAPAACEVEVVGENSAARRIWWAAYAAPPRPQAWNRAAFGDFENASAAGGAVGRPWTAAAVTGITGAATSLLYAAGGRQGRLAGQVTAPATANTGATLRLPGPFLARKSYTADVWVRSAAATTNARLVMGVSGDTAASAAAALSGAWVKHTVTWTPTATVLEANLAVEITAATATVFLIDGVQVYETGNAPVSYGHQGGRGARPPFGLLLPGSASIEFGSLATGLASWPYISTEAIRQAGSSVRGAWLVDATLVEADPHSESVDVEVYAYIAIPSTATGSISLVAFTEVGYTREYGSTGISFTAGTAYAGIYRVGTLSLPRDVRAAAVSGSLGQPDQRSRLRVAVNVGGGTGNVDLGWVYLMPARRRIALPTGKDVVGYPYMLTGSAEVARVRADGSKRFRQLGGPGGWFSAPGFGQFPVAGPGAPLFLMGHATSSSPSTNGSGATQTPSPQMVRFSPTPRWAHLRDE